MSIPFSPPCIGQEEEQAVLAALRSGWLSRGPQCAAFEAEFAAFVGASHAVSLSSCTAALHLALLAFDIGPGDEVITTPLTFPATVNAILYTGATPVLVDVRPDYNIDPLAVQRALNYRTRAVIGVDMHGLPCVKPELPDGVRFIRDAAHSVGAVGEDGERVGGDDSADATCFSFYATKNLACGEGGMLTTRDEAVAERVRRLSLHGMHSQAWKRYAPDAKNVIAEWDIAETGYKCNMTDIQAALGSEQLKKLPGFLQERRRLAARYDALLGPLVYEGRLQLPPNKGFINGCWHLYAVEVDNRDRAMAALKERGIGCGVHFRSVLDFSAYRSLLKGKTTQQVAPFAHAIGSRTLSLPFFVGLTGEQQTEVVGTLEEILRGNAE